MRDSASGELFLGKMVDALLEALQKEECWYSEAACGW